MPKLTKEQQASKKRAVTPEDLLKFQLVSDPQISPDGKLVSFTKKHVGEKNNYVTNIWVADTKSGDVRQFTSGGKDAGARWSPVGDRIAFTSGREKPKAQIYTISASGGEATPLTDFPEGSIGAFKWSADGKLLAVSFRETEKEWTEEAKKAREEKGLSTPARVIDQMYYRLDGDGYFNSARYALYVVDAETGKHRKIFDKDTNGWFDFDWAPNGKELVICANLDKQPELKPWKERLYIVDATSGKIREIPKQKDGTRNSVAWSYDGKYIAYCGVEGRESTWGALNEHLFICDPQTGAVKDLSCNEDYCMGAATLSDTRDAGFGANIRWARDSKKIYMAFGCQGEGHVYSIATQGGKITQLTKGVREFQIGSFSSDGSSVALASGSPTELNEIYVGEVKANEIKPRRLTKFNDAILSELIIANPEEHWLKSPSGTKVHVWVMKPANLKSGQKAPAVLEIHGGPHAQYGVPFFHEFQVLAANGYVVFYSNPRGSKGYGEEHCNAIKGAWGKADWEDIQAVIEFMKKQPYVDSKRMGVMGGSYGGYMTNWAIGHTDVFAGAITDRCVSNLVSMAGSSDFPNVPDTYWPGNAWSKPETLWEQSPLKYLGNAKTPTLVIHSEGDLRCNVEQGEQVFTTLKLLGVPTRFVRYPQTTSHGMSRSGPPDLRIHRLHQILDWWKKYLGKSGKGKGK